MDSLQNPDQPVIDTREMMTPKPHHSYCRLVSPSTGPPRGRRDLEDTDPMASLDHPALGKTEHGGGGTPPGLAANNGPPGQPGSKKNGPMAVKAGNPHHPHTIGGGNRPIHL